MRKVIKSYSQVWECNHRIITKCSLTFYKNCLEKLEREQKVLELKCVIVTSKTLARNIYHRHKHSASYALDLRRMT